MLFLGAGASKPMDLPDLHDLTKEIRKRIDDDPFKEIEHVLRQPKDSKDRIRYAYKELGLEIFLTILDSLADPSNAISELGPFAVYLYKLLKNKKAIDSIKIRTEVQDLKEKSVELTAEILGS